MTRRLPAGWSPTGPVIDLEDPARPRVIPPVDRREVHRVVQFVPLAWRFTL